MSNEPRHVAWLGVTITDAEGYARYRELMTPLLTDAGGRFHHDFEIERVLRSDAAPDINRVVAVSFPSEEAFEAFFSGEAYGAVKRAHLVQATAGVHRLDPAAAAAEVR